eukprot:evm.model.NODE_1002_length_12321_cov_22.974352.2
MGGLPELHLKVTTLDILGVKLIFRHQQQLLYPLAYRGIKFPTFRQLGMKLVALQHPRL